MKGGQMNINIGNIGTPITSEEMMMNGGKKRIYKKKNKRWII